MSRDYLYRYLICFLCGSFMLFLLFDYRSAMAINLEAEGLKKESLKENVPINQTITTYPKEDLPTKPLYKMVDLIDLSQVTARPLFFQERRPINEQVVNQSRSQLLREELKKPFRMVVTGIVTANNSKMVVLQDQDTRKEYTVLVGGDLPDNYTGWVLDNIEGEQVFLKQSAKSQEDSTLGAVNNKTDSQHKQLSIHNDDVHYFIHSD